MGMLVDGIWIDQDEVIKDGSFRRVASSIRAKSLGAVAQDISERPNDFWLIGSHSCPWSHRAFLICAFKQLPLPAHYAYGPRVAGYSLNGGEPWRIPGSSTSATHLHELYTIHSNSFTGRVTVPILWNAARQQIISNESADILVILDKIKTTTINDFTLRPPRFLNEMEVASVHIYNGLNNAVYRAGFSENQSAYNEAVTTVFGALDFLEHRLTTSRYYFGTIVTEIDFRIFPTLIRFDAIYAILFKCSLRRLIDYPNLWAYARDVFNLRGVSETVNLDQILRASYIADSRDPHPIIAIEPDIDWHEQHSRLNLGQTEIAMRSGGTCAIDTSTHELLDR